MIEVLDTISGWLLALVGGGLFLYTMFFGSDR